MNTVERPWTRKILEKCLSHYAYSRFVRDISPLELTPEQIQGKVLIIGQSGAFPEKTLLCKPETDFEEFRPEISSIFCCDPYYPSSPEIHLSHPCINTASFRRVSNPQQKTAYWELSSANEFLPKVTEDFFDTVLMFRIVDLGTQISELDLIKTIAPHLKQGGLFLGSGGRFPLSFPPDFFKPLTLVKVVRLIDYSGVFIFTNHTGIILQKS